MPWPTDPAEQFFGRGLWGWATNVWKRINSTAGGALKVQIEGSDGVVLIQQMMPTLLNPGIYGYDGATWRKMGLIWSYNDTIGQKISEASDVAATFWLQTADPDAGEVWRVLGLSVYRSVNVPTLVRVQVHRGGADDNIQDVIPTVNSQYFSFPIDIVLKEGQYLRAGFAGATIGETCELTYWGYQMAVG